MKNKINFLLNYYGNLEDILIITFYRKWIHLAKFKYKEFSANFTKSDIFIVKNNHRSFIISLYRKNLNENKLLKIEYK